jgi:hypothetical protein
MQRTHETHVWATQRSHPWQSIYLIQDDINFKSLSVLDKPTGYKDHVIKRLLRSGSTAETSKRMVVSLSFGPGTW